MSENAYLDTIIVMGGDIYRVVWDIFLMSLTAGEIVRLLKSDRDALRELAAAVASEPELRLAVINAVLADVATKHDINQLREEMRREMGQLRRDVNTNFRWTVGLIVAIWGTTVIPLLMRIAGIF